MREHRNSPELKIGEPLELRLAADGDVGTIAGYGSVFGVKDSYGDVVVKGAFAASLNAHKAAGTMPKML